MTITKLTDYEYDDDEQDHYMLADDDYTMWERLLREVIARQGPDYTEYQSCMWS